MRNTISRDRGNRAARCLGMFAALAAPLAADEARNHYVPHPPVENIAEGIAWPAGQALPIFASPADALDAIEIQALTVDERITFSALQGQVNRRQPRILLMNARTDEGRDTWANTPTVNFRIGERYGRENRYELVAKFADEVAGVVLYDTARSPHYRNLAGTVAALRRAIPATPEVLERMRERGIELEILEDLTGLEFETPLEIYGHLLENHWPNCEKRLLVSARPDDRGGDHHHTRDIAAAVGAAVVWLDNRIPEERDLMRRVFGDMKAGEAIVLGWYSTERSGITTASEFGIGTLPADHYSSGSVHSGVDHRIQIPPVPKMPELEDKVHIAIFISDGDNIQYTQRAMRRIWDEQAEHRGKVALNWTIAPGLVDIGPGILNYYYGSATPLDCFVTGPSGMGYAMFFNTLEEPGAPVGLYTENPEFMDGYTRLTETYLQRSGLRVVTIWDDATPMQRQSFERNGRNLYGVTVQNFRDVPSVASSVEGGRLRFEKLVIPYAGTFEHINRSLNREIRRWDGEGPMFLAYQVDVWNELRPGRLVELHEELNRRFPGQVEFVRADHYFNLHNRANGLPYNLTMAASTTVRSGNHSAEAELVTDGTPATLWSAEEEEGRWLGFDFGAEREITRYVIRHAGSHGLDRALNTRDFTVRVSSDGTDWRELDRFRGNRADVTDIDLEPVRARYLQIEVDAAGADGVARIAEVEIYGRD